MFGIQKCSKVIKLMQQTDLFCSCNSCFHSANPCRAKQGLAMNKIMGTNNKKKGKLFWENNAVPFPVSPFNKSSENKKVGVDPKRVKVLNKIFMRYITDLMVTGEKASEFSGHGIEISRIKVAPNFKSLNVYWIGKGDHESDCIIDNVLKKNSGHLRHELSTLRVIGEIPKINFVKDSHYSKLVTIDEKLAIADFGEDHVPVEFDRKLKSQLEIHVPLEPNIKNQIRKLDESFKNEDDLDEEREILPEMPHNVFGLNHDALMKRIKILVNKSKGLCRSSSSSEEIANKLLVNNNNEVISYKSNKEQREAFKEFLRKRQIAGSKSRKTANRDELLLHSTSGNQMDSYETFELCSMEDEDYLSEDE